MYTKGHLKKSHFLSFNQDFPQFIYFRPLFGQKKMQYNMTVTFQTKTKTVTLAE